MTGWQGKQTNPGNRRSTKVRSIVLTASAALVFAAAAVPVAAAVAPVHPRAATDWATYGMDLQRTGFNPSESTIGVDNASNLHVHWSIDLGAVMIAQPVVADDVSIHGRNVDAILVGTE